MNITTKSGRLHGLVLPPPNRGKVLAGPGEYEVTELSDMARSRREKGSLEPEPMRENPTGTVTSTMRRAAHPSGCARCGAGAGYSAKKYQSLTELSDVARSRRERGSPEPEPVCENPAGDCIPAEESTFGHVSP